MNAVDLVWMILIMLLMLLLKGFFSGSEIAFASADKIKLSREAKQGKRAARRVVEAYKRPERYLATTLIGTNIATVVLTTMGALVMIHFFGNDLGDLYAVIVLTPILLIFGEIVPKSVYQQKADEIAQIVVYPLRAFSTLLLPLVFVFSQVARLAVRLAGVGGTSQQLFVTREQLHTLTEMAERGSGTELFDRIRIERALRFPDVTVGEAMVPVAEIVAISNEASTARAIELVRFHGFNRLPVYEGVSNNVVGVLTLTTWDLLESEIIHRPLAELVSSAHYVSPHDLVENLLPTLRGRDDRMAIVVDEYGSTIGMITMEDVIETVVGQIDVGHEFENYTPKQISHYQELEDGVYLMDGRLPIHEVDDILDLELPTKELHTIGGLLVARLGHLASKNEFVVEAGYRFIVEDATERVVTKVRVVPDAFGTD